MISGHLGIECARCGDANDPLGVIVDSTGALVCLWCKAPDKPAPPSELAPAWVVGDYNFTDIVCEDHAREYAADNGLVWEYPGSTGESDAGYAYAVVYDTLESDYPHTCSVCDTYLETSLTGDGQEYVREHYAPEWWHLWGLDV